MKNNFAVELPDNYIFFQMVVILQMQLKTGHIRAVQESTKRCCQRHTTVYASQNITVTKNIYILNTCAIVALDNI